MTTDTATAPTPVQLIAADGTPLNALPARTDAPLALITGVSSGVGRAFAQEIAADYQLICCGRNTARLTEVLTSLPGSGHCGLIGDLAVADTFTALPPLTELQLLVHSAGVAPVGEVHTTPRAVWENSHALNVLALVELATVYRDALRQAGGHIIALNSGSGITSHARMGAYCASKFALRALTDALRAELPECKVTSIHPGRIDTPMQHEIMAANAAEYRTQDYLTVDSVVQAMIFALHAGVEVSTNEIILRPRLGYGPKASS